MFISNFNWKKEAKSEMKLNDWTIFLDSKKRVDLKKGNVKVVLC